MDEPMRMTWEAAQASLDAANKNLAHLQEVMGVLATRDAMAEPSDEAISAAVAAFAHGAPLRGHELFRVVLRAAYAAEQKRIGKPA